MAKLGNYRVDSHAIETGEWVRPGEEYDDLELQVRGFTDAYTDMRAARFRKAAAGFGGDIGKVPSAIARAIVVECLARHVLLDVRNLSDATGPVDLARYLDLMRSGDYPELVGAVVRAAGMVGIAKAATAEDAAGNSAPPSGVNSNGANTGA